MMKFINFACLTMVSTVLVLAPVVSAHSAAVTTKSAVKVTRLYSDKEGVSHFQVVSFPTGHDVLPVSNISTTAILPAEGYIASTFNKHFFWDWHTAPQGDRYLDIILKGSERIDASDGTSKTFHAGDLLLIEDNTGKGHRAQGLSNGMEVTIKLAKK